MAAGLLFPHTHTHMHTHTGPHHPSSSASTCLILYEPFLVPPVCRHFLCSDFVAEQKVCLVLPPTLPGIIIVVVVVNSILYLLSLYSPYNQQHSLQPH